MPRPFKVSHPNLVGYGGVLMSLGLLSAFFPWSASALAWPEEWLTILVWSILGAMLLLRYERNKTADGAEAAPANTVKVAHAGCLHGRLFEKLSAKA